MITTTTSSRIALVFPAPCLLSGAMAFSFSVVPQHRRSFVFELLVKQLSISGIIIRWRYPFPWYNAWQSDADASGTIQIAWGWATGELFAEVGREVVAVLGEEVIRRSLKLVRGL